jgi:tetratricopeptide (TPR) repeat protein
MLKPLCFMVMPYGRKATQAEAGKGPAEIDFNALWDRAYVPVITALGYEPVRADQDTGALIITQMLERLYFADLVLADMTIPNGNVYYEIGIRHAARREGCVLLGADWSRQLFDVAQMRTVRYPLPEGDITEATAQGIQAAIAKAIPALADGLSPMHQSIAGYPDEVQAATASTMKDQMARLAAFQGEVRAVRAAPRAERMARALVLVKSYDSGGPMRSNVALALLLLLRDSADSAADWQVVLGFIDGLPEDLRGLHEFTEQRALALSNAGRLLEAIAALQALVDSAGPTQERLGLLGGRYTRLARAATDAGDRQRALAQAIDHYERGMELDLNEYYCASNLPRLYRQRKRRGDEERAQNVLRLVIAACERAKRRNATDPWLRATLLGAAFDASDADKAEELADEVEAEGAARWQLDSTLGALQSSLVLVADAEQQARLQAVYDRLKPLSA